MTENLQAVFTLSDSAFSRGVDRVLGNLGRIEVSSARVGRRLQEDFESPIGSLTKLTVGFFTVDKALDLLKQGLQITSDFQRLESGLSAVSSSSIDFARTQAYLRKLSDDLGISYEALAVSYKGLKAATNGTVLEGQATERIFTAVVHAGAALKLTNDDIKGSLMALTQMISKGTVSMEEMRQQLGERLPGAFGLAAKAMGVSTAELDKMISSGQVMASDLLPKLADQLEKTYGAQAQANVESMAGGWTRATDQLKLFVSEFAKTNGIDTFFAKLGNGMANYLRDIRLAQQQTGSIFGTSKSYTPGFQKDLDNFRSFAPEQRESFLSKFKKNITNKEGQLDTLVGRSPGVENLAQEKALEYEIKTMKERYGIYRRVMREENQKAVEEAALLAKQNATALDPIKVLEQKKARFESLTQRKQGLELMGKSLSAKESAELATLTKALESAGVRKAAKDAYEVQSTLQILENARKYLADKIESGRAFNGIVSAEDAHRLEEVEYSIRRIKGEVEKPATLKIKGEGLLRENLGTESDRRGRLLSPLSDQSALRGYGTMAFYDEQISKIMASLARTKLAIQQSLTVPKEALDSIRIYAEQSEKVQYALDKVNQVINRVREVTKGKLIADDIRNQAPNEKWNSSIGISENWTSSALAALSQNRDAVIENAQEMTDTLQNVLRQGATGATAAMGELVDGLLEGTKNMSDLPGAVLGVVADMLRNLATALATSGAFMLLVPGLQGQALGQMAAATGLFAAAAAASSAAQPKRRAMAKGGTLSGPTDLTGGEYSGAKNRPEWVSPVDVGARLIAQNIMEMGGMGGGSGRVVFEIYGDRLRGVLEHDTRSRQSLG